MSLVAISEGADEDYFVLSWSEGIPFCVETCESFLSVDGCHESFILITCMRQEYPKTELHCPAQIQWQI